MKTDRLELFMRENREAFDVLEPDEKLWDNIAKKVPRARYSISRSSLVKFAAAAAIFVAGYLFSNWLQNPAQNEKTVVQNDHSAELEMLMEAKVYYSGLINQKEMQLFQLSENDPQIKAEIDQSFAELEQAFDEMSVDLNDRVASEEVIEAMVQSYRLKLEILEDMLQQLKAIHEPNTEEVHHVL